MSALEIEDARRDEAERKRAAQRAAREAVGIVPQKARSAPSKSSWIDDVRACIRDCRMRNFTLADLDAYHDELRDKHPNASDVAAAVRSTLQKLRDMGEVCFVDDAGSYIYLPFESKHGTG